MPGDTRPSGSEPPDLPPMRARPLVSIVIPSYNCERYIRQTLQGIVAQTVTDWEVIVVDDGSTDATVAIDPRVRVVQQAYRYATGVEHWKGVDVLRPMNTAVRP